MARKRPVNKKQADQPAEIDNSAKADKPDTWFLKIDEDSIFGPVPLDALREWAEQGRVAPGNEVSPDRETWTKAEAIPELKMQWMVEVVDGDLYGPLNIQALADLLDDGTIRLGAALSNRDTGETTTVRDKLADILPTLTPPAPAVDTSALDAATKEREALARDLADTRDQHAKQIEALKQQINELETTAADARSELDAARATATEESKTLEVELGKRVEDADAALKKARDELAGQQAVGLCARIGARCTADPPRCQHDVFAHGQMRK